MISYPYRARLAPLLGAVMLFGAAATLFVHHGLTNDRGLILNRVITLEQDGATIFYWVMAGCSAGFVLIGVAALATRLRRAHHLVLDKTELRVPHQWRDRTRVVDYRTVRGFELREINGQHLLVIETSAGKVTVAAIMLQSALQLREIADELDRRVKRARLHAGGAQPDVGG